MINRALFVSACSLAAFVPLAPVASAQAADEYVPAKVRRGALSAMAVGISLESAGSGAGGNTVESMLFKPPLDQSTAPGSFDPVMFPEGPDFRHDVMFPTNHADVHIDAFSTGNDVVPNVNVNGIPDLTSPVMRWMAITVAVAPGIQGLPDTLYNPPSGGVAQNNSGDLVTYYLEGSNGIPGTLVDKVHLEQSREHLGFPTGSGPIVDAMDWAMGIQTFSPASRLGEFFKFDNHYFFSVTPASALSLLSTLAEDASGNPVPTHAGVIYRMRWQEIAGAPGTYEWTKPTVYKTLSNLALGSTDDLDGIAVDLGHQTVVYSTQVVPGRSQLLVEQSRTGQPQVAGIPLRNESTEPITTALGSRDDLDDIRAICTIDPEPGVPDKMIASPLLALWPGQHMGVSMLRTQLSGPNSDDLVIQSTGWGDAPDGVGFVQIHLSIPGLGLSGMVYEELRYPTVPGSRGTPDAVVHDIDLTPFNGLGPIYCASLFYALDKTTLLGASWVSVIDH